MKEDSDLIINKNQVSLIVTNSVSSVYPFMVNTVSGILSRLLVALAFCTVLCGRRPPPPPFPLRKPTVALYELTTSSISLQGLYQQCRSMMQSLAALYTKYSVVDSE